MNARNTLRAALLAALVGAAPLASAQTGGDLAALSSQYAQWAGGKSNSDALVAGLKSGGTVTLVTTGTGGSVSLAGFAPAAPMSDGEIRSALAGARQSLARLGISRPTAEQIQSALIGGDVVTPSGATRSLAGVVGPRGTAVASR